MPWSTFTSTVGSKKYPRRPASVFRRSEPSHLVATAWSTWYFKKVEGLELRQWPDAGSGILGSPTMYFSHFRNECVNELSERADA